MRQETSLKMHKSALLQDAVISCVDPENFLRGIQLQTKVGLTNFYHSKTHTLEKKLWGGGGGQLRLRSASAHAFYMCNLIKKNKI